MTRKYLKRYSEEAEHFRKEHGRLSESLEDAWRRTKESEKLSTIGRLASGICHDINNPLAYISTNLELIKEAMETLSKGPGLILEQEKISIILSNWASSEEVNIALEDSPSALADAADGCRRIRDLIAGMKSLVYRGDRKVPASLAMLAADSARIVGSGFKEVRILTHLEDPLPIECAPCEIVRVITNLIVNAGQASGQAGIVTVAGWREGDVAVLEIADNGPGIPLEIREKIFEPFFTTKAPGEGTGLGLSISCEIVASHDGELRLHSTQGQGTRVQIRLPLDISKEDFAPIRLHEWKSAREKSSANLA